MSNPNIVWIASIDIGKKNFAFYIEEFDKSLIISLPRVAKNSRYKIDGTPTPAFENIVRKVCDNGKVILYENNDLTEGCDKDAYLDPETFHNMTDLLDTYVEYWDQCDAFVIEKQMSFSKIGAKTRNNTMAVKLGQHCWSYFSFKYGRFKEIIEFPAYNKTQILGAKKTIIEKGKKKGMYKTMDKPERKKWSVQKAIEILNDRKDCDTLDMIKSKRKKDDLGDVLCQLQAFKIMVYFDGKL